MENCNSKMVKDIMLSLGADLQSWVISCHKCRDACPFLLGSQNALIKL